MLRLLYIALWLVLYVGEIGACIALWLSPGFDLRGKLAWTAVILATLAVFTPALILEGRRARANGLI